MAKDKVNVKSYSKNGDSMKSVWKGDKRYGFVSKDRIPDSSVPDRYRTRYGAGIDNVGNPYRGVMDREINTPLGTLEYGYDGDTVGAGFTPNMSRTTWSAPMGNGQGTVSQDYFSQPVGRDALLQAGRYGNSVDGNTYFANALLPGDQKYIPDYQGGFNTPVGRFGLETNYDSPNTVEASFSPNYYIQALANLLRR